MPSNSSDGIEIKTRPRHPLTVQNVRRLRFLLLEMGVCSGLWRGDTKSSDEVTSPAPPARSLAPACSRSGVGGGQSQAVRVCSRGLVQPASQGSTSAAIGRIRITVPTRGGLSTILHCACPALWPTQSAVRVESCANELVRETRRREWDRKAPRLGNERCLRTALARRRW
jgi:hypothetical protein